MLKAGAVIFSEPFTVIFNKLFMNGDCPQNWGHGVITTIHKAGDQSDPTN